ncbi:arylsulfatase [Pontiellaceae bacterium B12227]|nr:arylsulfatase [Pontiellaceae bacterium B12227]
MKKRNLLAFAAMAASTVVMGGAKPVPQRPNIIYILCDDLGYGDVGICNPDGKIPTPNMDRLGREGMVFTDAHSGSAVCTPTRYGVLTGRYCWRSRKKSGVLSGYSEHLIEEGRMTVASLLKENGYHTAYIGKWHMGWDWHKTGEASTGTGLNSITPVDFTKPIKNGPKENGFIYSYGHCGSLDMPPYVYVENGIPTAVPDRETVAHKSEVKNGWWRKGPTAPDFDHWDVLPNFTRRAVKYVEEQARTDKPFFLYLPYSSPHTPVLPTSEYKGKSGIDSAYADFTTMNDECIGQVMKAVEKAGIADNTLIIVTSDNGCSPEADFKELIAQGHNPSSIYRGHKADIFEGGHRVPFIVRWPAKVQAGSICADTTCLTDMLATCADIVGAKLPADAGEDSVSMLPNLIGTADQPVREATVHHSINGTFAIRQGKWKLVDAPHSGGWSAPRPKDKDAWKSLPAVQLFDMEADPAEATNVQDQHPETVERLKALLEKYKNEDRSAPAA